MSPIAKNNIKELLKYAAILTAAVFSYINKISSDDTKVQLMILNERMADRKLEVGELRTRLELNEDKDNKEHAELRQAISEFKYLYSHN